MPVGERFRIRKIGLKPDPRQRHQPANRDRFFLSGSVPCSNHSVVREPAHAQSTPAAVRVFARHRRDGSRVRAGAGCSHVGQAYSGRHGRIGHTGAQVGFWPGVCTAWAAHTQRLGCGKIPVVAAGNGDIRECRGLSVIGERLRNRGVRAIVPGQPAAGPIPYCS